MKRIIMVKDGKLSKEDEEYLTREGINDICNQIYERDKKKLKPL